MLADLATGVFSGGLADRPKGRQIISIFFVLD